MKKAMVLTGCALLLAGKVFAGGGGAHWGYSGQEGPEHWGALAEEYKLCGSGKNQSPIDIDSGLALDAELESIQFEYRQVPLELINNGHTIQASYANGSNIMVDGRSYRLVQFHFHTPSENAINGKLYDMEAHLVHADETGNLAVVGVMFEAGEKNAFIEKVWEQMPAQAGATAKGNGIIDATEMLPEKRDYYLFSGSLTTPPCSEGVKWMVLKEPVTVSKEQVEKFHATMHHDNNRPVQPLFARKVLK